MQNPWIKLPKIPPHILLEDFEVLTKYGKKPEHFGLQLEILPIPYLGNFKKASVVLLCLNPGYHRYLDRKAYEDKYYFQESLNSLTFSNRIPFLYLDTKLKHTGGYKWWTRLLKRLTEKFGIKILSEKLMCLQYLPYHSKIYSNPPCILPSQKFTFSILRRAIKNNKIIVIMRSKKLWFDAVPELKTSPFIELKNYRMPYITERNTKNGDFQKVIEALQS